MDNLLKERFEQKATLTARALMEKRELIEQKKNKKLQIDVKDLGVFEFRIPTLFDIEDANASQNTNAYLVYACCEQPNLKDPDLQKEFGADSPLDIVDQILMPGEVVNVADVLVKAAGYDDEAVRVIEKVKN